MNKLKKKKKFCAKERKEREASEIFVHTNTHPHRTTKDKIKCRSVLFQSEGKVTYTFHQQYKKLKYIKSQKCFLALAFAVSFFLQ